MLVTIIYHRGGNGHNPGGDAGDAGYTHSRLHVVGSCLVYNSEMGHQSATCFSP